jgi:hypothetical protein
MGWATFWAIFFTNSSGHTEWTLLGLLAQSMFSQHSKVFLGDFVIESIFGRFGHRKYFLGDLAIESIFGRFGHRKYFLGDLVIENIFGRFCHQKYFWVIWPLKVFLGDLLNYF